MNEYAIQQLKDSLREIISLVTQRGKPLSPELKAMIAQAMEHVAERIQTLRQQENQPTPNPDAGIDRAMPSSNIYGFNYDYDNGKLLVKFQGNKGEGEGSVYGYEGVPPYMFNLFKRGAAIAKTTGQNKWGSWWRGKSPSIGSAFHSFIKGGGYPYQKLS